jgi:hypothetical protein
MPQNYPILAASRQASGTAVRTWPGSPAAFRHRPATLLARRTGSASCGPAPDAADRTMHPAVLSLIRRLNPAQDPGPGDRVKSSGSRDGSSPCRAGGLAVRNEGRGPAVQEAPPASSLAAVDHFFRQEGTYTL